jgi:hypothetical protein
MGLFDSINIDNVQAAGNFRYLKPGNYTLELTKAEGKLLRNAGNSVCLQALVLASDDEDRHPVGSVADIVISFQKQPESAKRDVKGLMLALAGLPTESKDLDSIASLLLKSVDRTDNPFAGLRMQVYAYNHVTKAGGDFTRFQFSPEGGGDLPRLRAIAAGGPLPPLAVRGPVQAPAARPPAPPAPAAPPPAPKRQAGWALDPTGQWALNPATNAYERAEA